MFNTKEEDGQSIKAGMSIAMLAAYHRFKERRRRSALILSANRLVDVWSGMHLTVRSVRTSQAGEKLRTTEQV